MKRVVATIFVVILCFCGIFGKVLLNEREAARQHAVEVAERLLATLTTEIARTIDSYSLSLEGLIDNLKYAEITTVSPEVRQALLFDRSSSAKHLHAITLLDEEGVVRLDSREPFPKPERHAQREHFRVHKQDRINGIYIGPPYVTPNGGVLAISRRVLHTDGSFAGVAVGTIRQSFFQELFENASLGPHGNILLMRTDGQLLVQGPHRQATADTRAEQSDLLTHHTTAKAGAFETDPPAGIPRIFVYNQIGDLPLLITIGQTTSDVYSEWRRHVLALGSLMALLCTLSGALTLYLIREIKRRSEADRALAMLATEDSLTGLANRRHFDSTFANEWRRARRAQTPIALIMCDADEFKRYNDKYGHQAGDRLLQVMGSVLKQNARAGADLAARYGGDEFIVLLPGTPAEGAERVAGQIRAKLAAACEQHGIAPATLSIGAASLVPRADDEQALLLTMADEAAYKAKAKGRDRIEMAPSSTPLPAIVATPSQRSAA